MDNRPGWDEYFMEMAVLTARRSTCLRRHVGAVIVQEKHIVATGYNGAPRGLDHCGDREGGCLRQQDWGSRQVRSMNFAERSMRSRTPLFRQRLLDRVSKERRFISPTSPASSVRR